MIEDEEHTKQEVERLISREFEKLKVQDITTEIYKTAEEFLEVKKHYDVVISDIDLPGKSGIDLGRILKAEQKDICLEAYQYILKRDMKERLPAVLQKIYQEKQKESQNFFWIGGVTDQRKLYHKDIICIRKVKGQKYVEFVMVNGAYKERLALHQIFEDLKSPAFIFAGRSYIINIDHVDRITPAAIYLEDGIKIQAGAETIQDVKTQIMEYWRNVE